MSGSRRKPISAPPIKIVHHNIPRRRERSLKPELKRGIATLGTFATHLVDFDDLTIVDESKTLLNRRPRRSYNVFIPNDLGSEEQPVKRVLFLFHGTDETSYRTQLLFTKKIPPELCTQEEDPHSYLESYFAVDPDIRRRAVFDLAVDQNLLLVYPQSRGAGFGRTRKLRSRIRWGWQPDDEGVSDMRFVSSVIEDVKSKYGDGDEELELYAVGFSNGGMFLSEILIRLGTNFLRAVNYMGGMEWNEERLQAYLGEDELEPEGDSEETTTLNDKLLFVTATKDENRTPCIRAKAFFEKYHIFGNGTIRLVTLRDRKHGFYGDTVRWVWDFLIGRLDSEFVIPGSIAEVESEEAPSSPGTDEEEEEQESEEEDREGEGEVEDWEGEGEVEAGG